MNTTEVITLQCFTHEQVKEINKIIKKNIYKKEERRQSAAAAYKIGEFFHVPCNPLVGLIHPWLEQCQRTNQEIFGYDIFWDFHLDILNYNVYGTEGEYGWHIDADTIVFRQDMKLTCLLNLSEEPYEGGKFHMITQNKEIIFESGMGIILNSLIAHKTTPVTKGERMTLTYWGLGPCWR